MSELESFDWQNMTYSTTRFLVQEDKDKVRSMSAGTVTWGLLDSLGNIRLKRNIYRGWNLGTAVTDKQWEEIRNGTFRDMFIGDYWDIGGVRYVIADFDYFLYVGETTDNKVKEHHVTIVTNNQMAHGVDVMNDTAINASGYSGSKMRTETIPNKILPIVKAAFGEEHILRVRRPFSNAVDSSGNITGYAWDYSYVDLLDYGMIFSGTHGRAMDRNFIAQFSLFALYPRSTFIAYVPTWLTDPGDSVNTFLHVSGNGPAIGSTNANNESTRIRPVFSIYAE